MTTHAQPADTAPASRKRSRKPKRGSQNASVSVAKMGMIGKSRPTTGNRRPRPQPKARAYFHLPRPA